MSKSRPGDVLLTAGGSSRLVDFWDKHPPRSDLSPSTDGSGVFHESGTVDPVVFGQAMHLGSISCEETVNGHGHGSQPELPEEPSGSFSERNSELLAEIEHTLRQCKHHGVALRVAAEEVLRLVESARFQNSRSSEPAL